MRLKFFRYERNFLLNCIKETTPIKDEKVEKNECKLTYRHATFLEFLQLEEMNGAGEVHERAKSE
jgi:hypothetical protein